MKKNIKKAQTSEQAWELQETYKDTPHGWIQWKGTAVCMDIHCKCGCSSHIDEEYAYYVKCPKCGAIYMVNGHVEFIEIEEEPELCVVVGKTMEMINSFNNTIKP